MAHNYRTVIPWHELEKHLLHLLSASDAKLRRSSGEDTIRYQGRSQVLEELLNLPEALAANAEADEQAKKDDRKEREHAS